MFLNLLDAVVLGELLLEGGHDAVSPVPLKFDLLFWKIDEKNLLQHRHASSDTPHRLGVARIEAEGLKFNNKNNPD